MQTNNPAWPTRFVAIAIAAMVLLAEGSAVAAAKPEVRDHAHLLDAATVQHVNAIVREIQEKFGKDLTIETFPVIPEAMQPSFSAQNKEQFYETWLNREAVAADTNGVFILIVNDPGHLHIGVGNRTRNKAFTYADRDALRDLMLKELHQHDFDNAIAQGAAFVLQRMNENQPGTTPPTVSPVSPPSVTPETPPGATTQPAAADVLPPAATKPAPVPASTKPVSDVTPRGSNSVELNK